MIGNDDFTAYRIEWQFTPRGNVTDIVYRSKTVPNIPVPAALLRDKQKAGVEGMFDQLLTRVAR
jgi:hypothetical protein